MTVTGYGAPVIIDGTMGAVSVAVNVDVPPPLGVRVAGMVCPLICRGQDHIYVHELLS